MRVPLLLLSFAIHNENLYLACQGWNIIMQDLPQSPPWEQMELKIIPNLMETFLQTTCRPDVHRKRYNISCTIWWSRSSNNQNLHPKEAWDGK
jgi:hypothetical protein